LVTSTALNVLVLPTLSLRYGRFQLRIARRLLEQARVPHPIKVMGMAVKDHVARVTALVAVVFIMQRLVQVADEMLRHNHYDLMAFTTPGESPLRCRQNNREVSHLSWFLDDWQDPELSHEIADGAQRRLCRCAPPQSNQNFAERFVYGRVNALLRILRCGFFSGAEAAQA